MKLLASAFVLAAAFTGVATVATPAPAPHKAAVVATTGFMPVASCPPNDPNACGVH